MAESGPSELSSPKPPGRFEKAVGDAVAKFMRGDFNEASEKALEFFFNQLSIKAGTKMSLFLQISDLAPRPAWDIGRFLDDPLNTPRKGERFDAQRRDVNKLISRLFEIPQDQTAEEKERMMRVARSLYSHIIRSFVGESLSVTDPEFKTSLKGIAWSILARDIDTTLIPKGQGKLSPEWRNKMRIMILANKPEKKKIWDELKKFEAGDADVFS